MLNELHDEGLKSLTSDWKSIRDLPMDIMVYDDLVWSDKAERKIEIHSHNRSKTFYRLKELKLHQTPVKD